ncbi:Rv2175c family DNA-binding protein [Gordonia jinhuaensis]|uniref:DNA-binding protein n=1 Tax=Gordonia jinhuaensis TaxID=1517702 RepID=A0A916SY01_9ACTN|nr:Rv2175c family DNA-binding protein [Gordonia jinhuaensis]GGB19108.1 DNA-binding protein [Gordonia jinhuaensis]
MVSLPLTEDFLPADREVLDLDEVARLLGVSQGRVRTLIADHTLLALRRDCRPVVPAVFFDDGDILKHLTGLIAVLIDGGYQRDEVMHWLFTEQDDLAIMPIDALHGHQAREMMRRAQAQAF